MEIHFGSDHRGVAAKRELSEYAAALGHRVIDHGPDSAASVDYPDYAVKVGHAVSAAVEPALGILICGSGVGIAIPANKLPGIRCAVAWCEHVAEYSRRHNEANVLAFGADVQTVTQMKRCLQAYLAAAPEGGRHAARVVKINALDDKH